MAALDAAEAMRLLDASFGKTAYTNPTAPVVVHLGTNAVTPTQTVTMTKVTGGSYAAQTLSMAAATSPGTNASNAALTYTNMPATTVAFAEVWDSAGTPRRQYFGALTASKTTNAGDTLTIPSGSLTGNMG